MADALLTDPLGRQIRLSDAAWYGHIVKRHPEMRPHRLSAERAIGDPLEITYSNSDANCRVYYASAGTTGLLVAVVADVVAGFVKTAYRTRRVIGDVEWSRPTP